MWNVRYITQSIDRPWQFVYAFASDPQNLPAWASGLSGSITRVGDDWIADSPMGKVKVKFVAKNDLGVLDHEVTLESGVTVYNPMRVVANGTGSEVVFTLFQRPEMTADELEADVLRDPATVAVSSGADVSERPLDMPLRDQPPAAEARAPARDAHRGLRLPASAAIAPARARLRCSAPPRLLLRHGLAIVSRENAPACDDSSGYEDGADFGLTRCLDRRHDAAMRLCVRVLWDRVDGDHDSPPTIGRKMPITQFGFRTAIWM